MKYNIGVDIGGTTIKSGIVDEGGHILFEDIINTKVQIGFEKIVSNLIKSLHNLVDKSEMMLSNIGTIGLGVPGVADKYGKVHNATNLYWSNVPLGQRISDAFPDQKIYIENDATIAGIAEKKFGGLKGVKNGIILTLGTGIGGGIIIEDKPYTGVHGIGSEVGHMIIGENNFYNCSCGNNGCFETYCSAIAVSNYMKKMLKDGEKSSVLDRVKDIDEVTTKMIFEEYAKGDKLSVKVVDRFIEYFAKGIASLINILDPQVILIGGGLSRSFNLIEEKLDKKVEEKILHKNIGKAEIKVATLGNDAGIIGASMIGSFY